MMVAGPSAVAACGSTAVAGDPRPAPRGPPAVVASRGIAGILEEVGGNLQQSLGLTGGDSQAAIKANSVLDTSLLPSNAVLLNVYEVGDSEAIQKINRIFTANNQVMVGGVFHAGVELYGHEWGYGSTVEDRTGVGACHPRLHPQHTYRATVHMGETQLSKQEVHALVQKMAQEWRGPDYNLIHNNCCTFCNALLKELGLRRIPGWVDRAARAASNLDTAVQLARGLTAEGVQAKAAETLEQLKGQALDGAKALESLDHQRVQADVQAKALEIGEKAQEIGQALGASLWQLGQDLHATVQAKQPELAEFGEKAQEALRQGITQLTEDVQRITEGQQGPVITKGRRRVGEEGAEGQGGGDRQFLRASENRQLKVGLLEDDDDDAGLTCFTAMDTLTGQKASASANRPCPPAAEAPEDWLSGPSVAQEPRAAAASVDLLSGDLPSCEPAASAAAPPASKAQLEAPPDLGLLAAGSRALSQPARPAAEPWAAGDLLA